MNRIGKTFVLIIVLIIIMSGCTVAGRAGGEVSLIAEILHIDDEDVLVEVAENDDIWQISQRIGFHRTDLDDINAVVGDIVIITYIDFEAETYPAWIRAVSWSLR